MVRYSQSSISRLLGYVSCVEELKKYKSLNCAQDAAWMLPPSSPLKCTAPSEVYSLLKSSDFVLHDLDPAKVYEGCEPRVDPSTLADYELELVLRKWYPVDRSRELRCFVRRETLIGGCSIASVACLPMTHANLSGISQRDPNYYDFWNEAGTQAKVLEAVTRFWEENIKGKWEETQGNCTSAHCKLTLLFLMVWHLRHL